MLTAIAIALVVLWAVGLLSSYTFGGFIQILLLIAVILLLVRVIKGK